MNSQTLYEELELLPPGSLHPVCKATLFRQRFLHQLVQVLTVGLEPKIRSYFTHNGPIAFSADESPNYPCIPNKSEENLRI